MFEHLEPRQFMSVSPSAVKPVLPVKTSTILTQAPAAPRVRRAATGPGAFDVRGGLLGRWSGNQYQVSNTFAGQIALEVFQNRAGDTFALLKFNRPDGQTILIQSQFTVYPDGHFTFISLTPNQFIRFEGTISNHDVYPSSYATMSGTLQLWTRQGTYKASFSMILQSDQREQALVG